MSYDFPSLSYQEALALADQKKPVKRCKRCGDPVEVGNLCPTSEEWDGGCWG